jgi:hypothetical protein
VRENFEQTVCVHGYSVLLHIGRWFRTLIDLQCLCTGRVRVLGGGGPGDRCGGRVALYIVEILGGKIDCDNNGYSITQYHLGPDLLCSIHLSFHELDLVLER